MPNPDAFITDKNFFRWREFLNSETATAKGINNIPAERSWVWENMAYLTTRVLDPLREHFGPLRITSGYRSTLLNRAVGGSSTSLHCFGMAADIKPVKANPVPLKDIFVFVYEHLPYTELVAEDIPYGWIHVGIEKGRDNEKQLKYKMPGAPVVRGTYRAILEMFK